MPKTATINASFTVLYDDVFVDGTSEEHADWSYLIVEALEHYAKSRKASALDKKKIDKMLWDHNR